MSAPDATPEHAAALAKHEAELRELRTIVYRLANGKCACGMHTVQGEKWPMPGGTHGPAACVESSGAVLAEVRRPT